LPGARLDSLGARPSRRSTPRCPGSGGRTRQVSSGSHPASVRPSPKTTGSGVLRQADKHYPLRRHAVPAIRAERAPAARDLCRTVAELQARPADRQPAGRYLDLLGAAQDTIGTPRGPASVRGWKWASWRLTLYCVCPVSLRSGAPGFHPCVSKISSSPDAITPRIASATDSAE